MSPHSHLSPVVASFDWFPDHTAEQRMGFVRTARDVLRTGLTEDGHPLTDDGRALIESYLARELRALRPRLVVAS